MIETLQSKQMNIFSFDAESDGLWGRVWAIGVSVLDPSGNEVDKFVGQLEPTPKIVTDPWVRENIVPVVDLPVYPTRHKMLNEFWWFWIKHRESSLCVADFGSIVEGGLFRECVKINPKERMWLGPYPQHELGTALLMAGIDPDTNRRVFVNRPDLVAHDPYADAVASGLSWLAAEKMRKG